MKGNTESLLPTFDTSVLWAAMMSKAVGSVMFGIVGVPRRPTARIQISSEASLVMKLRDSFESIGSGFEKILKILLSIKICCRLMLDETGACVRR